MALHHKVKGGDCISSIAMEHGFFRKTLEEDPKNAELLEERGDLTMLVAGEDSVFIPDKRIKTESLATGQVHRFLRKGVPEIFRRRFLDEEGKARSGLGWLAEIDGALHKGSTDDQGVVELAISPDAAEIVLRLTDGTREEVYSFGLGRLPPVDTVEGLQTRLQQLARYQGEINGELDEDTIRALEDFQNERDLAVTGEFDESTTEELEAWYEGGS